MKKSQVATEFMLMAGLAMIIVFALLAVGYKLIIDYSEEKTLNELMDLGYSLQNEFILAAQVEPGYQRTITLPERIGSNSYSVRITGSNLTDMIIPYKGGELIFAIPSIRQGSTTLLTAGSSYTIIKDSEGISIN